MNVFLLPLSYWTGTDYILKNKDHNTNISSNLHSQSLQNRVYILLYKRLFLLPFTFHTFCGKRMSKTYIRLCTNDFANFSSDIPMEMKFICAPDTELDFFWGSDIFSHGNTKKGGGGGENQPILTIGKFQRNRRKLESAMHHDLSHHKICWSILFPPNHDRYENLYAVARDNEMAYTAKLSSGGIQRFRYLRTRLFTIPYFLSLDHKHADTLKMIDYLRSNTNQEYLNGAIHIFLVMFVFSTD